MSTALQIAGNVLQILLEVCIVGAILKSGSVKRFPWFFSYICYQIGEAAFRWLLYWKGSTAAYYYWYWRFEFFDLTFSFVALAESWLHVFRSFWGLIWFRLLIGIAAGGMLSYCWWAVWTHPRRDNDWLLATILQLDLTFTFVPLAVSFLYFGLRRFFGITGYRRETGIMLGYMIASAFSVAALGFRVVVGLQGKILGVKSGYVATWVPVIGYVICEVIWFFAFLRPSPVKEQPRLTTGQINERLGEYLQVLGGIARAK